MPPRNEQNGSSLPRTQGSSASYTVYPTDSVQDVAEVLGLPPLKESVASALAADVEYRIRQVVQDASKFMRHGKRTQLRVADLDRAMRQRNIEPIFGFHPTTLGKASASGAYPTPVGSSFRRIQTQSGPIHLLADEEIDLEKILDDNPKVAVGPGVGWSAHWLAIEGVQPAVPQNPTFVRQEPAISAAPAASSSTMVQPGGASAFLSAAPTSLGNKPGQPVARPLIKHVLSRELQLYFERLTAAIIDPPNEAEVAEGTKKQDQSAATAADQSTNTLKPDGDDDVNMASPKELSGEADAKRASQAMPKTSGNTVRDAALASLRGDPGLHQLVPYLIQWINEKIQSGLRDEQLLEWMLHTVDALISNPYLGIEPYLHQLLPYILSILLTSSLGHDQSSSKAYILRIQAASILGRIIAQYGPTYPNLKPRVLRTIITALDAGCAKAVRRASAGEPDEASAEDRMSASSPTENGTGDRKGPRESASTKLGALVGLRVLGPGSLRAMLVSDGPPDRRPDCLLRRLGFWCDEVGRDEHRREEVRAIVDEVKTAFAEVSSSLRGDVSIAHAAVALHEADVREHIGQYWIEPLASEAEAARGVLALLSELFQQQNRLTGRSEE